MQPVPATNIERDSQSLVGGGQKVSPQKRGLNVFTSYQLVSFSGRTREGSMITGQYEQPYFNLDPETREDIARLCSPVFGMISGRMNRMSSLEWSVQAKLKDEDRLSLILKERYAIYKEFSKTNDLQYRVAAYQQLTRLRTEIPDLLPDASNFNAALVRWRRRNRTDKQYVADEIEEWLRSPNGEDDFEDYLKKWTSDYLIHGAAAQYKSYDKKLEKIYILPGGSVIPLKSERVGGPAMYAQLMYGLDPLVFRKDEIVFTNYVPYSSRAYGKIPLEALVNKITEELLFSTYMAERADGTKPPEKAVVFGIESPFGNPGEAEFEMPVDPDEQKRVETKINEARKEAIITLTGHGHPVILDLSRENVLGIMNERMRMIREEMALVFNMSNMEINSTDSSGVSGRATGKELSTLDQNKAIIPIAKAFSTDMNMHILPYRYGSGWEFGFDTGIDEFEEIKMLTAKLSSGAYAVNEIRMERGDQPFEDAEFDKPRGAQQPDGTEQNPMFVSSLNGRDQG